MPVLPDGTPGDAQILRHTGRSVHPTRQQEPHPHAVIISPDNRFVIVPDLGLDRIFSYALDAASARLTPAEPPFVATTSGAGPRHFKFTADGRHACAVNELGNTVTTYDYESSRGALTPTKEVSTLPPDFTGSNTTAEIRIHPNGRFVYASNRGHDSIAVFALDAATGLIGDAPVQIVASGGRTPRNFDLSPDGRWLVCGHQDSEWISVFGVDPATGRLARTEHTARVPGCVCVLFHD
jgi:6-phosphogluconolactonase